MPPANVAIIGDSFPNRLLIDIRRGAMEEKYTENLNIDSFVGRVQWLTRGGLTLPKLLSDTQLLHPPTPFTHAILHLGSNDLTHVGPRQFVHNITHSLWPRLQSLGCRHLLICQALYRRLGKYTTTLNIPEYNSKVDMLNLLLKNMDVPGISYWEHRDIIECGSLKKVWNNDGVHLAPNGHPFFWRSLRGAVLRCLTIHERYISWKPAADLLLGF